MEEEYFVTREDLSSVRSWVLDRGYADLREQNFHEFR